MINTKKPMEKGGYNPQKLGCGAKKSFGPEALGPGTKLVEHRGCSSWGSTQEEKTVGLKPKTKPNAKPESITSKHENKLTNWSHQHSTSWKTESTYFSKL